MNKMINPMGLGLLLVGVVFFSPTPTQAENSQTQQSPSKQDFEKYIGSIEELKKQYANQLAALNKEKGYDPKIYSLIMSADDTLSGMKNDVKDIQAAATDLQDALSTVKNQIKVIQKMKPKAPKTFPEACADTSKAKQYQVITGFIDKAPGSATDWVLKAFDGTGEYKISKEVGLIGQGTLVSPSTTPPTLKELGWLDKSSGSIVCIETAKQ